MKTLRLVLPLIVLFLSTAVCSIYDLVTTTICDDTLDTERLKACHEQETLTAVESDRILELTLTQSVLDIIYPATATLTQVDPIIATATLTLTTIPQTILQSGTYEVEVSSGGKQFHSTWTFEVVNEVITGNSGWDCCPNPRVDSISGTIIGEEVTIVRDCSGQGYVGPCSQTYNGRVKGNIISGTITGKDIPASGATWTLHLSP